ncbi:MAG TPA: hypothetical protein VH186_23510 [Chloroflexia bacterium]|nr:hypothetical protein [Chloroflexia bacterium]
MEMSNKETKTTSRQQPARRTQMAKAVVPAPSRAATARKLEPEIIAPEIDELDLEVDEVAAPPNKARVERERENRRQEQMQLMAKLIEKRDEYVERLDVGAAKIEEARGQGRDVTLWEDYWIQLLHQYEAVCDRLRDLYAKM